MITATATAADRETYTNGEWFDLDPDILGFLIDEEEQQVRKLFDCRAFQAINSRGYCIIFHPCTRSTGGYQVSLYDAAGGAVADIQAPDLEQLTKKYIDSGYKAYTIVEIMY